MVRRLAIYALLIIVGVGSGLYIFSREESRNARSGAGYVSNAPPRPANPWKASSEHDAEANEGFSAKAGEGKVERTAGKGSSAEWPQFNGLARNNKSTESGLLQSWPSAGPKLAWTSRGVGLGYSTVAVANGVVYTMGNKGANEAVIALDAGTGEKIWSTPFAWASKLSAGEGPRSTPTIGGDAVFALGGQGDLVCIEAGSGKIRWQKNILQEFDGGMPSWGICESVLFDENRVICTPGGSKATIVALNPQSGEVLWKSLLDEHDHAGYASATPAVIGNVRQYVQFTAAGTVGVRADDGSFLWRDNSAANGTANCSSPLIDGDSVFSASNYGTGGSLVKLSASSSRTTAKFVYHTHDMASHHGEMVINDGLLFGSSDPGVLTCLDFASGKVKWRSRSAPKGAITFADNCIYLRTERGAMILVEATASGYHELGRFEQADRSKSSAWPHPVVAAGKLFLRDQDVLLAYDLRGSK